MTSQEYITRKAANTIVIATNSDGTFTLTSRSFDPVTGVETDNVETTTLDAVQSEANQIQITLDQANEFLADLQAQPIPASPISTISPKPLQ